MSFVSIKPVALVAALAVAASTGGATGWITNGWRLGKQIADLKRDQEKTRADQATQALADLAVAAHNIRTAADGYTADVSSLGTKLDALRKDFKNAKPLPADCRPDDFRVRHLGAAVDAANQAAAGQ